ncbi:unnamed protein product, partial [Rotaria socialis]
NSEFQKLSNSKGDLLSFNSFMSSNVDPEVANVFCSNLEPNTTGILFKIEIDPSFSSNPFALLTNVSYLFDQEQEILLSTHAIFRIGEMIEIENRLWHVQLILTTDNDKQLEVITEWIRSIAVSYEAMGNYLNALSFYKSILELKQTVSAPDTPELISIYVGIGTLYNKMEEYSNALSFYHKALEIKAKYPNYDELDVPFISNIIGSTYCKMNDYQNALLFYQKTVEIEQNCLHPSHIDLATAYNNIGTMHSFIGNYSSAIQFYQKVLEVQQNSLPPDHPDLTNTRNKIIAVREQMEN